MISLQRFEETFSLYTAQALDNYARYNTNKPDKGEFGLRLTNTIQDMPAFAELAITGLPVGELVCLNLKLSMDSTNQFKIMLNTASHSHSSPWYEEGWKNGEGYRSILFKAPQETMYLAIGDSNAITSLSVVVDNVELLSNGIDLIPDGNFEIGISEWTSFLSDANIEHYEYNPPIADNPYLEPVDIPVYDAGNSKHCRIPTDAPWNATTLNSSTWEHFYIESGIYSGRPEVTRSGTSGERRTISPYTDVDTHPGKLADLDRVKMALKINANYWTIDKMSSNQTIYHDWTDGRGIICFYRGASYNIISDMYFGEGGVCVGILRTANNNTIQRSYFDGWTEWGADLPFIELYDDRVNSEIVATMNNKIILNEGRNNKVVRLQCKADELGSKDYQGTIVDNNIMWYDEESFCDSNGNQNDLGDYSLTEADFGDMKSGSEEFGNPVIYTNNAMWGAKPSDPTAPNLGGTSPGFAYTYYSCKNIQMRNNIVIDCSSAYTGTSNTGNPECWDILWENNIAVRCGYDPSGGNDSCTSLRFQHMTDSDFSNNLIKDPINHWANVSNGNSNSIIGHNDIVNVAEDAIYTSPVDEWETNNFLSTEDGNSLYPYDYTINYMKYTATPQTKVVSNVLKTPQGE